MEDLRELKAKAQSDMVNFKGILGFADGIIGGKKVVVTAKLIGVNQPSRKEHVRFTVTEK